MLKKFSLLRSVLSRDQARVNLRTTAPFRHLESLLDEFLAFPNDWDGPWESIEGREADGDASKMGM